MISNRQIFLCLLILLGSLVVGCSKSTEQVTQPVDGILTMDGSPLAGASITFVPASSEGTVAAGSTDAEGKFKVQTVHGAPDGGTTPGEYRVTVTKIEAVPTGRKTTNSEGETIEETTERSVVPAIYGSTETTPLGVTITKGKNAVTLELDSSAK